jgi:hypothetical protein
MHYRNIFKGAVRLGAQLKEKYPNMGNEEIVNIADNLMKSKWESMK